MGRSGAHRPRKETQVTIPCPFNDPYAGSGNDDPNHQVADLLDHVAAEHCPSAEVAAVLQAAATKMRNPTGVPDPNRIDDLSQYMK